MNIKQRKYSNKKTPDNFNRILSQSHIFTLLTFAMAQFSNYMWINYDQPKINYALVTMPPAH